MIKHYTFTALETIEHKGTVAAENSDKAEELFWDNIGIKKLENIDVENYAWSSFGLDDVTCTTKEEEVDEDDDSDEHEVREGEKEEDLPF